MTDEGERSHATTIGRAPPNPAAIEIHEKVAETEGFEPSVPYSQYDGLANRWFQPLTHVSKHGLNTRLGRDSG